MDYKNTPEGRAVQSKYADLLSLSRPAPIKSRMTIQNRAKIFSPFAALRGYEDEIASEGKDHLKVYLKKKRPNCPTHSAVSGKASQFLSVILSAATMRIFPALSRSSTQLPANCESRLAQRLLLAKTYRPSSRLVIYLL